MIRTLSPVLALLLAGAACAAAADTPAVAPAAAPAAAAPAAAPEAMPTTEHSEGGSFKPFYGEVFHKKRYYLFGSKAELAKFRKAEYVEMNPLKSKMFIGKGPSRATVVIETDKDAASMTERLLKQFRTRHNLPN